MIVNEDNTVLVFHTRSFDIFDRGIREEEIEMMNEPSQHRLQVKRVAVSKRAAQEMGDRMGVDLEKAE